MSLEGWKSFFEDGGVILLGLTFVFGLGFWYFSNKVNAEQKERLQNFESDLTKTRIELGKQQERAAKAEGDLLELQHATLPRNFDPRKVGAKLPKIKGLRFRIFTLNDFEVWHTGALIAAAGQYADWSYTGGGGGSSDELTKPGVWVEVSPLPETTQGSRIDMLIKHSEEERANELKRLRSAATGLCSALNAEGVEAKVREPIPNRENGMMNSEPDSLTIFVSLKPMPGMPDDLRIPIPNNPTAPKHNK